MASGDDKLCREARAFVKGIVAVEVKKGLGVEAGILLPPARARQRIRTGAAKAVAQCARIKPFKVARPVRMRLELVSRGRVPCNRPGVKVVDGRTYEVRADSVETALNLLV
jgi:D-aminopeptidase